MKKYIITLLLGFIQILTINAQTIYFEEDFEEKNGKTFAERMTAEGWFNDYVENTINWRYENGGHSTDPSIPYSRRPIEAHSGNYNALFEKSAITLITTKLVTPEFDLSLAIKPELTFWFANNQRDILAPNHEEIRVYYRSIDEDTYDWVLLYEILDENKQWTDATIIIPDSVRFTNIQLAFEGTIGPGWGACIDDIEIVETGIVPKFLETVTLTQASLSNIPTGSINNPILRLNMTVKGNDGELYIDKLIIDALLNSATVVPNNGVKLFFTTTSYFTSITPINGSVSFINGKATFNNIPLNIPFGYSYIWITYDVPTDASHVFDNLKLDGKILKDNIIVNGLKYPFTDLDPSGYRQIKETILFDDFENGLNWSLTGEFEVDEPIGLGGTFENPDPTYAQNGIKVLGTDLTDIGITPGDYENNLANNGYLATGQTVNCKYYKDITLQYYRWLNIENADSAKLQVSINGSSNWQNAWINEGLINDNKWVQKQYSISQLADRKDQLTSRFVVGPTNNTWTFSGWNIDDFAITGTFIQKDAGIASWVSPSSNCGNITSEPLMITVKNYGYNPTSSNLPIGYSIDGGENWIMENVNQSLAQEQEFTYTFTNLLDVSAPGEHHIIVKTFLPGDQDDLNDILDTILYILPTQTLPYTENFENGHGFWTTGGTGNWEHGSPNGTKLNSASSGIFAWATGLTSNYSNNDSSWIESPCFDFTGIEKPVFEVMLESDTEIGQDGLALYYSIDDGKTWKHAPETDPYAWNWYNNSIVALGNVKGWDKLQSGFWMARQTLPTEVSYKNPVKFRLVFAADNANNNEGFVVDDIRIYNAPTDAGAFAIAAPADACNFGTSETLSIEIKNFGIRKFVPSDALITTIEQEGEFIVTDTFYVTNPVDIGSTAIFPFTKTVDLEANGFHNFKIYTHVDGDSNIYTTNKDTLTGSVESWSEPEYTLGPDIGTLDPNNVDLDAGAGYSYLWAGPTNNGATSQIITNVGIGVFTVTVTSDSHGCVMSSSIEIINSVTNLAVAYKAGLPATTACAGDFSPALEVTITNYGSLTYTTGDIINVGYQINNDPEIIESYTIKNTDGAGGNGSVANGDFVNYAFTEQPDLSIDGIMDFKLFSVFTPDLDYSNDTAYKSIEIYQQPNVDLGQDTIYSHMLSAITLDAGSGFLSYKWQETPALNTQTYNATSTKSAKYYVEVADNNGCGTDSDTVWIFTDEWSIDTILDPSSACDFSTIESITLRLNNESDNTYSAGLVIPAQINLNGTITNENITLTDAVAANSLYTHNLVTTLDLSAVGVNSLMAIINPTHDVDTNNNKYFKEIENYEIPKVSLGYDTIITKRADTIILDASDNFASYSWNRGGSNSTFAISEITSLFYKVTAIDKHNCAVSRDSVQIMAYDVAIDEIKTPRSTCDLKDTNRITFILHNYGNDIIYAGTNMTVSYKINNAEWIEKPFTLQYNLLPNKTKAISIAEDLYFTGNQTYDFSLALYYEKDFFTNNNTIHSTIFEFSKPNIELGPDIYTTKADTVVLWAQDGFTNYQWQDLSREKYFNVSNTASAEYHCLVNNAYGCIAADTVNIYTYDIQVGSVNSLNKCSTAENNRVTVNIQLNSSDTLRPGHEIIARYEFDGNIQTETIVLTDTFTQAANLPFTFSEPIVVADTGNYSLTVSVEMDDEVITDNNEATAYLRIGAYTVSLGDDITTNKSSVVLDAGPGYAAYVWNDGSNKQTLTVNSNGEYLVTTTDINGCYAKDTIEVLFINPQYHVSEIIGLANSCDHTNNENITFSIHNTGNDTINAGKIIPITYKINSENLHSENYTFTNRLNPNELVNITFNTSANLSVIGEYTITVTANFDGDISNQDTTINTWGSPSVDLGDDIASVHESVVLNAGIGFVSYLWSTNETTQTITVTKDGTYSVTVSADHSCTSSDAINVHFIPVALAVIDFTSPREGCQPLNKAPSIVLKNAGEKAISKGSNIIFGYRTSGQNRVNESIILAGNVQPNATFPYKFKEKLIVNNIGNVGIQFYVNIEGVEVDTADYTMLVKKGPVFSFESDVIKVGSYPYVLDPKIITNSYLWNTGATTPTITVNADGSYSMLATATNNCTYSDTVYVKMGNAINDVWSKQIAIYPNPATSNLNISIPQSLNSTIVEITDTHGKAIERTENAPSNLQYDISNWSQGVYFVRIYNNKNYAVFKVIVQ